MIGSEKKRKVKSISLIILAVTGFATLGCNLSNAEIWGASRILEDDEREMVVNTAAAINQEATNRAEPPVSEEALEPNNALEYSWQMGVRCIESPGNDPCPLEACIPASDQYNAVLEKTVELFGKANPDNYECGADFRFTNNSGMNLLIWANSVSNEDDLITIFPWKVAKDDIIEEHNYTFFSRHEGVVTYRNITDFYVLYDNPHCEWIQYGDPELGKFAVELMNPCGD